MATRTSEMMSSINVDSYIHDSSGDIIPQTTATNVIERLLDLLDLKPGHRVLEIGTGSGLSTALLAETVGNEGRVVTVDIDSELTSRAEHLFSDRPQVTVIHGDGRTADIGVRRFDRVVAWTTPSVIPASWVDGIDGDGIIVSPVKVAEAATANLTAQIKVRFNEIASVTWHSGSFVDATPTVADYRLPADFVDAVEGMSWISSPALRETARAAEALKQLDGLTVEADDTLYERARILAHLAATDPKRVITAATPKLPGVGVTLGNTIVLFGHDSWGWTGDRDTAFKVRKELKNDVPDLDHYSAEVQESGLGWKITITTHR